MEDGLTYIFASDEAGKIEVAATTSNIIRETKSILIK